MGRTMSFYDLRDALGQPGCAICRLKEAATERYLDGLLWEMVNDAGVRAQVRQARGFCVEHGWALVRPGGSLGIAILMRDVVETVCDLLGHVHSAPTSQRHPYGGKEAADDEEQPAPKMKRARKTLGAHLAARLTPETECPACAQSRKVENSYLDIFLENLLVEDGLLPAYRASDGLCLPHFRQALARCRDEATAKALIAAQREIWERLAHQLSEFIRKNDYRFRDEPMGDEGDAWLRAIGAMAGARIGVS